MNAFWLFLVVGVGLLAIELLVFQFTTFWLFFVGLGALVAAAYAWLLQDAGYLSTTLVFVVASGVITALLFSPLRKWQSQSVAGMAGNNAVGQRVEVTRSISDGQPGLANWSGSEWQAELADGESGAIPAGDRARVVAVEGIRLLVKPA